MKKVAGIRPGGGKAANEFAELDAEDKAIAEYEEKKAQAGIPPGADHPGLGNVSHKDAAIAISKDKAKRDMIVTEMEDEQQQAEADVHGDDEAEEDAGDYDIDVSDLDADELLAGSSVGDLIVFKLPSKVYRASVPVCSGGLRALVASKTAFEVFCGGGDGSVKKLNGDDMRWTLTGEATVDGAASSVFEKNTGTAQSEWAESSIEGSELPRTDPGQDIEGGPSADESGSGQALSASMGGAVVEEAQEEAQEHTQEQAQKALALALHFLVRVLRAGGHFLSAWGRRHSQEHGRTSPVTSLYPRGKAAVPAPAGCFV